jgi:hypothetical protein
MKTCSAFKIFKSGFYFLMVEVLPSLNIVSNVLIAVIYESVCKQHELTPRAVAWAFKTGGKS